MLGGRRGEGEGQSNLVEKLERKKREEKRKEKDKNQKSLKQPRVGRRQNREMRTASSRRASRSCSPLPELHGNNRLSRFSAHPGALDQLICPIQPEQRPQKLRPQSLLPPWVLSLPLAARLPLYLSLGCVSTVPCILRPSFLTVSFIDMLFHGEGEAFNVSPCSSTPTISAR